MQRNFVHRYVDSTETNIIFVTSQCTRFHESTYLLSSVKRKNNENCTLTHVCKHAMINQAVIYYTFWKVFMPMWCHKYDICMLKKSEVKNSIKKRAANILPEKNPTAMSKSLEKVSLHENFGLRNITIPKPTIILTLYIIIYWVSKFIYSCFLLVKNVSQAT